MRLLDANVLIYALNADAVQHDRVAAWLKSVYESDSRVLIPSASALAYLRVATNPRVFSNSLSLSLAMSSLRSILDHPKTNCPEPGDQYWEIFANVGTQAGVTAGRLSDVHIAALAIEQGAVLCSTDRDFLRFHNLLYENPLD